MYEPRLFPQLQGQLLGSLVVLETVVRLRHFPSPLSGEARVVARRAPRPSRPRGCRTGAGADESVERRRWTRPPLPWNQLQLQVATFRALPAAPSSDSQDHQPHDQYQAGPAKRASHSQQVTIFP